MEMDPRYVNNLYVRIMMQIYKIRIFSFENISTAAEYISTRIGDATVQQGVLCDGDLGEYITSLWRLSIMRMFLNLGI